MGFLLDGGWECGPVGLGLGWHWRAVGLSMMETQLKHGDNHWVLAHLLEVICPVWELPAKLLSLPLPAPPVTQTQLEHFCSWRLTTSWDSPCPGGGGEGWVGLSPTAGRASMEGLRSRGPHRPAGVSLAPSLPTLSAAQLKLITRANSPLLRQAWHRAHVLHSTPPQNRPEVLLLPFLQSRLVTWKTGGAIFRGCAPTRPQSECGDVTMECL